MTIGAQRHNDPTTLRMKQSGRQPSHFTISNDQRAAPMQTAEIALEDLDSLPGGGNSDIGEMYLRLDCLSGRYSIAKQRFQNRVRRTSFTGNGNG